MKTVVCTLFERDYHVGAAVLVNSLCRAGFAGTIYAGFRGELPAWAAKARKIGENKWELQVTPEVRLVLLKLSTTAHFTNYKPDFLLEIEALGGSEAAVYCDPDLVLTGTWREIDDWLTCGVAVCEDVNSPMGREHPRRVGWRRFFRPLGFDLQFRAPDLANGGFVGLRWEYRKLLLTWKIFLGHIAETLGGADVSGLGGGRELPEAQGFANCLGNTDQDALNAALEALPDIPVSFLGAQAMGFQAGRAILPHALGPNKPWRRHYIREALGGNPPNKVDRAFWQNADQPLQPFSGAHVFWRRQALAMGSALGRFIRRT